MNIPRAVGKDDILEKFDFYAEQPYFSMWKKGDILGRYKGDDFDEAKEYLTKLIDINKVETEPLTICLHTESAKTYDKKSPTYAKFTVLINEDSKYSPAPAAQKVAGAEAYLMSEIERLRAEIDAMRLKQDIEEDEDEEEEESDDALGSFTKIIEHPIIAGLISSWTNNPQKVNNLAGTTDDINECLSVLFSKGVTITHLKKLADMPESKIKLLLSML